MGCSARSLRVRHTVERLKAYLQANRCSEKTSERGSAIFELAISITFLSILTFGVISLSYGLQEHAAVAEAVRVGARAAAMLAPGQTPNNVSQTAINVAQDYLQKSGFPVANYSYNVTPEQFTVTHTGNLSTIRFNITKIQATAGYFGRGGAIGANITAEYPLAKGNAAASVNS